MNTSLRTQSVDIFCDLPRCNKCDHISIKCKCAKPEFKYRSIEYYLHRQKGAKKLLNTKPK